MHNVLLSEVEGGMNAVVQRHEDAGFLILICTDFLKKQISEIDAAGVINTKNSDLCNQRYPPTGRQVCGSNGYVTYGF
jgi:hypothetical protein